MISKYAGIQGLCCGLLGVLLWFSLDTFGLHRFAATAGVTTAITSMLVVLGRRDLGSVYIWIAITIITCINFAMGLYFFGEHDWGPAVMIPAFILELVAFSQIVSYTNRSVHEPMEH